MLIDIRETGLEGERARVATPTSDKIDFHSESVIRDKRSLCSERGINYNQQDITVVNIYAPKYICMQNWNLNI